MIDILNFHSTYHYCHVVKFAIFFFFLNSICDANEIINEEKSNENKAFLINLLKKFKSYFIRGKHKSTKYFIYGIIFMFQYVGEKEN
jgi:hypothetical protein